VVRFPATAVAVIRRLLMRMLYWLKSQY